MQKVIRIGTRRSKLSLWQANHVSGLIRQRHPSLRIEIHEYKTRGDLNPSTPLPAIGGKGLFTEALEAALRRREIDCAVHSLKDLPVDDAAGLTIGAIPKRGDHRDALVTRSGETLAELPAGARIGTGSLRRRAQLLAIRPDLKMLNIRGNVPTRIEKLLAPAGQYDAIVLATAGLQRLGLAGHISEIFDEARLLSAAGQGALALQCRDEDESLAFFAPLTDLHTELAVTAERAFLGALEGGCSLPVGAFAQVEAGRLQLTGRVNAVDGARQVDVSGEAFPRQSGGDLQTARKLGARLAEQALEKGASLILQNLPEDQSAADSP